VRQHPWSILLSIGVFTHQFKQHPQIHARLDGNRRLEGAQRHHVRVPAAGILQAIRRRTGAGSQGRPGMPQVTGRQRTDTEAVVVRAALCWRMVFANRRARFSAKT